MNRPIFLFLGFCLASLPQVPADSPAPPPASRVFHFGEGTGPGEAVAATTGYQNDPGFGFESTGGLAATAGGISGANGLRFSARVPAGNHRVTLTVAAAPAGDARVTIKAELRRLMIENLPVPAGTSRDLVVIVNTRVPAMPGGESVRLKAPRETIDEAIAWDDRITLEILGPNVVLKAVKIEPIDVPVIYLLGDSTVCDQPGEPYASWGQMLPRFLKPDIAVANHAHSGESVRSSISAGRFDKVLSLIRPGDRVLIQFGHNDQKAKQAGAADDYRDQLAAWSRKFVQAGARVVLVLPVHRHSFGEGKIQASHGEYPARMREAAALAGVPVLDLASISAGFYEALGEKHAYLAFVNQGPDDKKFDHTHHNAYGAHVLARGLATALMEMDPEIGAHVVDGFHDLDPASPPPPEEFTVPASPVPAASRPAGS